MSTEKLPFKPPFVAHGTNVLPDIYDSNGKAICQFANTKERDVILHMLNTWPKLVEALAEAITLNSVAEHAQDEEWQSKLDECNKVYDAAQLPKGKPIQ